MGVRSAMVDLIARVSDLIGDANNATFTTQQVQDSLDRTPQFVRYEILTPAPDIVPQNGGNPAQFNWATYFSKFKDWESDAVVQAGLHSGQNWAILTPLSSDYLRGRWTFDVTLPTISTSIPAQLPPVFIVGTFYDPYLAAAYLLERWAAQSAGAYDFTSDGQTFKRSQIMAGKLALAREYRANAKPRTIDTYRGDLQRSTSTQPVRLFGESNDFTR